MAINIEITADNTEDILKALQDQALKAMEECGIAAESYTVQNIDEQHIVDTGALKGSITYEVVKDGTAIEMNVGTNLEYGVYNELGTGRFVAGGRNTPWTYQDAKGEWHRTDGMRPRPFLKPAIADHAEKYKEIIEDYLKN